MGLMDNPENYQAANQAALQRGLRFKYDPNDTSDTGALEEWYRQFLENQDLYRGRTEGAVDEYDFARNPVSRGWDRTDIVRSDPLGGNLFRVTYRDGSTEVQDLSESKMMGFVSRFMPIATTAAIGAMTAGAGAIPGAIGGGMSAFAGSGGDAKAGAAGAIAGGAGGYMKAGWGLPSGAAGSELAGLQASTADIAPPPGYQDTLGPYVTGGNSFMATGDPTQGIAPPAGYQGELGKYVTGATSGTDYSKLIKPAAKLASGLMAGSPAIPVAAGMPQGQTENGSLLSQQDIPLPEYLRRKRLQDVQEKKEKTWQEYSEEARKNQRGYYGGYLA